MIRENKKGADKIISVYWFVILFIVAAAIVYMVSSFYGKPYEVRQIEAGLLADKAAECVSYAGYLKEGILIQTFRENFLETCGLNFQVEDIYGWREQEQYFLKIDFSDFNSGQNLFSMQGGNENLKDFCALEGKNLPFCTERKLYSLGKDGKLYTIKITSIIKKTEKNA